MNLSNPVLLGEFNKNKNNDKDYVCLFTVVKEYDYEI